MTKEQTVKELCGNLPEYSLSLHCLKWDYDNCVFVFFDEYEKEHHTVNLKQMVKGFNIMTKNWDTPDFEKDNDLKIDAFLCNCDACFVDAMVQCAIFEEVIYG